MRCKDAQWIVAGLTLLAGVGIDRTTNGDDVWMVIEQVTVVDESFYDSFLLPASCDAALDAPCADQRSWLESCPCLPPGSAYPSLGLPSAAPLEPTTPETPSPASPSTGTPPGSTPLNMTPPATQSNFGALQGGTLLASSSVPGMMGDFFGVGGNSVVANFFHARPVNVTAPNPAVGASTVGRQKLTENSSPVPRDRIFVNYSYFNNVPLKAGGVNVNRLTPGFEKTFFNGSASIEFRVPMASTLSSNLFVGSPTLTGTDTRQGELGNLTLFAKQVLWTGRSSLVSGGVGVALPTADDLTMSNSSGVRQLIVKNRSVHILPFIGGVYLPNQRLFAQWIAQVDVDANGQPVQADFGNSGLVTQGRLQDRTYLFADASVGYWLHNDPTATSGLTGFAPMAELHLNQSLSTGDALVGQSGFIANPGNFTLINAVVGATALVGRDVTIHGGYAFPLGGGDDAQFDGEFRLMVNWFFGGPRSYRLLPN